MANKRIANRYYELFHRGKIVPNVKYKVKEQTGNHVANEGKKKLYKYYNCDYCNAEIKIVKKRDGIVILPRTLTKKEPLKLVLCDKCIKPVIAEFEEED